MARFNDQPLVFDDSNAWQRKHKNITALEYQTQNTVAPKILFQLFSTQFNLKIVGGGGF